MSPRFKSEIDLNDSSVISKVRYDRNTNTLDVKLKSGNTYRYRGIHSATFADLVCNQSSGKVYNERVKQQSGPWNGRSFDRIPRKATKIRNW
jgi:hypothetical protein